MSTLLDSYLKGAICLYKAIDKNSDDHEMAYILYTRLEGNIDRTKRGETPEIRNERNEINSEFNKITERLYGINFTAYCQTNSQQQVLPGAEATLYTYSLTQAMPGRSTEVKRVEAMVQGGELSELAYDFLNAARMYIETLAGCLKHAGTAFNGVQLQPRECSAICKSLSAFSHPYRPSHDPELLKIRTTLQFLSEEVEEFVLPFQIFCPEAHKPAVRKSRTTQALVDRLNKLDAQVESARSLISSIAQKKLHLI